MTATRGETDEIEGTSQGGSTNVTGSPAGSDSHSLTLGPDGPILLHDRHFIEQMAHFNRERVPERNVHAKGSGAFGVFETTEGRSDGTFTVKSVVSPDDGKTWGPTRSQVFVPSGSGNNGPSLPSSPFPPSVPRTSEIRNANLLRTHPDRTTRRHDTTQPGRRRSSRRPTAIWSSRL